MATERAHTETEGPRVTEFGFDGKPPGEHDDELPDEQEQSEEDSELQKENAETSQDQPSQ